ncbi:MAG TPA: Rho termination factor N-terminal domain-containing protein, partial [Thermoguttaceae bacterium]|nr:Rho termination factor N-terminal domain-containing protein [Thermoguttaceae bacterium]
MSTIAKLRNRTVKDLAAMAKRQGVSGWHSMRKEELVVSLAKLAKKGSKSKIA